MTKYPSIVDLAEMRKQQAVDDCPSFVSIKKKDPDDPSWFVTIKGSKGEMEVTDIRDLYEYKRFNYQCGKQLDRCFRPVKPLDWANVLIPAMAKLVPVKADDDATLTIQFEEELEEFLTNRQRSKRKEDLLMGWSWEDEGGEVVRGEQRYYFRMRNLENFLGGTRLRHLKTKGIIKLIKSARFEGGDHQISIKNKNYRVWWVPSHTIRKAEELPAPKFRDEGL